MNSTERSLSTSSTLNEMALPSIRRSIATFLQRCGLKYTAVTLDERLYIESCKEAINRGLPMDGKYSVRPFIAVGVAIAFDAYAHLPNHSTKMWICLYTAVATCIDDIVEKEQDMADVYCFNERFATCQPQGNPLLRAFDEVLREVSHHYLPLASNLIVTSTLNFMSSFLLDHETKNMKILTDAPLYSEYSRNLSGISNAYGLFIFPPTLPLVEYIQCMPDLTFLINHMNDILSYYKEEIEGETVNYLSLMAASRALTKQEALDDLIDNTVQARRNVLQILRLNRNANDAFLSFFDGYFCFHAVLGRYKLDEIMLDKSEAW